MEPLGIFLDKYCLMGNRLDYTVEKFRLIIPQFLYDENFDLLQEAMLYSIPQ